MKKLLLTTSALIAFGASPAFAGPLAGVFTWISSTIAAGGVAGALVQAAIGVGFNLLATALAGKKKGPSTSVQSDVEFGDDTSLNFIVGKYATAGKLKYRGSWGKNTRFITEVFEVSSLPQGFSDVWINDERGDFTGDIGYVSGSPGGVSSISKAGSAPSGKVIVGDVLDNNNDGGNRLWIKWVDGTQSAADPFLKWAFGSGDYPWTSAHIGTGKTYAIVTSQYDKDTQTSLPSCMFEPEPLPMYDPRLDSSVGGVGSHRWGDRDTYEPTTNPAVIAYNVARGIYFGSEWVYGGRNLDAWRLPLAEWVAAMNADDASVARSGGGSEAAYRCGANVTVDTTPADLLEEIGLASNMRFAEVGGKLKPIVDVPTAAVLGITDADIITTESQSLTPFLPISSTFNSISATYPEPDEKWSSKDAPEYIDDDATDEDGGRYMPTSLSYAACPYAYQVQRLMRSQMRDYRRMRQHQFYLPPDAYALEPLVDCVSWTSERNGYANKLFLVTNVSKTPGMNVLVTLSEIDPSDYDWDANYEKEVTIIDPRPSEVPTQAITNFAAVGIAIEDADSVSRRSAIKVSCDTDEIGVTNIRIQARLNGVIVYDETAPFGDGGPWFVHNVIGGQSYDVRAELLSAITPLSAWSAWVNVTPPNVGVGSEDLAQYIKDQIAAGVAAADAASEIENQVRIAFDELEKHAEDATLGLLDGYRKDQKNKGDIARAESELTAKLIEGQEALAEAKLELQASIGETNSLVLAEQQARADGDVALANSLNAIATLVGDNGAAITAEQQARSDADTALAGQISTAVATAGTAQATATAAQTAVADVNGKLGASITFRTKAGSSGAELELVAANDPTGESVSAARISAEYILLDGTVTAPMMNVTRLSAITATLGHFKSAESGERVEIKDDFIKVFDDTGALRVHIGDLTA
ncbi:hypothetical protein [Celeribacter sp.]|uniref:hypothetical protein n=1 Tax=Celeribacter sp. TaxID=1890673 RepID=UPI003A91AB7B